MTRTGVYIRFYTCMYVCKELRRSNENTFNENTLTFQVLGNCKVPFYGGPPFPPGDK